MAKLATFISGLTRFRGIRGKVSMLEKGYLTPARLVKYAVKGESDLRAKAAEYIVKHPKVHAEIVNILSPYLNSNKKRETSILLEIKEGGNYRIGLYDIEIRDVHSFYPERKIAQDILGRLLMLSDNVLRGRIQKLLEDAPAFEKTKRIRFAPGGQESPRLV